MRAKQVRKGCWIRAGARIGEGGEIVDPDEVGEVVQNVSGAHYLDPLDLEREVLLVDLENGSTKHWKYEPDQIVEVFGVKPEKAA